MKILNLPQAKTELFAENSKNQTELQNNSSLTGGEAKITPLFDRLLVKQIQALESQGGIIIPKEGSEKPQIAKVLAVGNGLEQNGEVVKMILKPGDTVVYSKYAGSEITVDNEILILIKQCDILGVMK